MKHPMIWDKNEMHNRMAIETPHKLHADNAHQTLLELAQHLWLASSVSDVSVSFRNHSWCTTNQLWQRLQGAKRSCSITMQKKMKLKITSDPARFRLFIWICQKKLGNGLPRNLHDVCVCVVFSIPTHLKWQPIVSFSASFWWHCRTA